MPNQNQYTEEPNCPICTRPIKAMGGAKEYAFEGHQSSVVQCVCGLWGLTPRLPENEMMKVYQSDGYFHDGDAGYDDYEDQKESLKLTFRNFLKNVHSNCFVDGGLFEIGTGDGLLMQEAIPLYKYRAGTDFGEKSAEKTSEFANEIFTGGFDAMPSGYLKENSIYTVVATNVIEHVYDPVGLVKSIYEELPKGGVLVLAAPDMGSFWRKILGKKWPSFKLPEHVFYYDEESLSLLMRDAGFGLTKPISCPHYFPVKTLIEKAGLSSKKIPHMIAKRSVKLPNIMTAIAGVK